MSVHEQDPRWTPGRYAIEAYGMRKTYQSRKGSTVGLAGWISRCHSAASTDS